MYSLLIDTIKLRIPSEYYQSFKQHLKDNGYKLRQCEHNKYITKVYVSGLQTSVLKVYQNNNRFASGCYIESYGLGTYIQQYRNEKEMALRLTIDYLHINNLLAITSITKLDVAIDIKAKPSNIIILRSKGVGRSVQANANCYSDNWFKDNTLYIEGSNLKQLKYKSKTSLLLLPSKIESIVGTKIYDINQAYKEANGLIKQTVHAFKKEFKSKYDYWFEGDYFIIKDHLITRFNFNEAKFSLVKKQNTTTAILYDKANKEGLNGDLSRFEVRVIAKDIKGQLGSKNGLLELLNGVYNVLKRYELKLGDIKLDTCTQTIKNWGLLNTYNN